MSSFFSRMAVLAAIVLVGCGSSSSSGVDIKTLVPASGDVTGWTRKGELRVLNATQATDDVIGLDGAADPFFDAGLVQVAEQYFERASEEEIKLYIWQLTSTNAATTVYNDPRTNEGTNWQSVGIGDADRLLNIGPNVYLYVRKGVYCIYATFNSGTTDAENQVRAFATKVVEKIH